MWKIHTTWLRLVGYLPPCAKLRVPSDLSLDLELVNWPPNIQTEAEFSILMSVALLAFRRLAGRVIMHMLVKGPSALASGR